MNYPVCTVRMTVLCKYMAGNDSYDSGTHKEIYRSMWTIYHVMPLQVPNNSIIHVWASVTPKVQLGTINGHLQRSTPLHNTKTGEMK